MDGDNSLIEIKFPFSILFDTKHTNVCIRDRKKILHTNKLVVKTSNDYFFL